MPAVLIIFSTDINTLFEYDMHTVRVQVGTLPAFFYIIYSIIVNMVALILKYLQKWSYGDQR